jgi:NAD(P)-dependent dehydrogenase (short-subunit alcohol dehydrogenase family)
VKRPLQGKTALVTGGAKGIGRETARALGRLGASVVVCGRDAAALARAAEDLKAEGIDAEGHVADVRDPDSCAALVAAVREGKGRLDILVNNAGMSMRGSLERTDPSVLREMADVNYLGPAYMTHFALPLLRASRGSVLFVSSLSALHGLPFVGPYGSSKQALTGLAESLRAELAGTGVHVGVVYVGFTENDPGKVVYAEDGRLAGIGPRRNSHSQAQAAAIIARAVLRRRRSVVLTPLGMLAAFVYRHFPALADRLIEAAAGRSTQYAIKD